MCWRIPRDEEKWNWGTVVIHVRGDFFVENGRWWESCRKKSWLDLSGKEVGILSLACIFTSGDGWCYI